MIKNRAVTRRYEDKSVPVEIVEKIIDSGVWSSSIHGFQPWKFMVINGKDKIKKISEIVSDVPVDIAGDSMGKLVNFSARVIADAPLLIMVYNTKAFTNAAGKFFKINREYIEIAQMTEIEGISGAIQNMIMMAESLGVGSCWLTTPLFCESKINDFLNITDRLVAVITFGYSMQKEVRSPRKNVETKVNYVR
ncbi:MAG: hypothetical protein GY853_03115 [PVC group bacterium]|nr:hypothetical protein [PVC group bacterium]